MWYNKHMKNYDLSTLNEQQLEALYCTEGAVLVTAGAGSGKTRLLTHKIAYLVKEKGVSPYNILAITFTNKAANEMKQRLEKMIDDSYLMWVSTFHSMCCRILREDISHLGYNKNFTIYSDAETDKLIDLIIKQKNLEEEKKDLKKEVKFHISNCKNANMSISQYEGEILGLQNCEKIIDIFKEYQSELKKNNAVDFDDLLVLTYQLFTKFPEVLNKYAQRFKYILVDEFQDTNLVQYQLVKLLSNCHQNIFVVGDEDQCIYSWRGASYQNISKFVKELNAKTFKLELNYRSTPDIITVANKVIKNNLSRIDKTLIANREGGTIPEYFQSYDEEAEAQYVVGKIKKLINQGYKYKDMAILLRISAISLAFEQALLNYNIPYAFYGGFKFFERAEIKNILAYLRLFINPDDEISLLRIINFPKRGIGDGTMEKLREQAKQKNVSILNLIISGDFTISKSIKEKLDNFAKVYINLLSNYETMPLEEFVVEVMQQFEIRSAYNPLDSEDADKLLNFDTFMDNVKKFAQANLGATLDEYIESVTLSSDIDSMDSSNNNVILATIHSVKGLEFKCVFIVGSEEKIFPIARAYDNPADMEEERRLMYVAITRAEERLFFTCCKTRYLYGRRDYARPSRFLKETGVCISPLEPQTVGYNTSMGYQTISTKPTNDYISQFKNAVFNNTESQPKQEISCDYAVGDKVLHPKYNIGEILSIYENGKTADVKFEGFGVKTLILSLAPIEKLED